MTANRVLIESIRPYIQNLLDSKLISQWFFIRYSDPDFHIRLRMKLKSVDNIGEAMVKMWQSLDSEIQTHVIGKIQIDTYQREIERYGEDTIEDCEQFFYHDSESVLKDLKEKPDDWKIIITCIGWISQLYSIFYPSYSDCYKAADSASILYIKEFGLNNEQIAEINSLYRNNKKEIQDAIVNGGYQMSDSIEFLKRKRPGIKNSIIPSLIHMHCNRMFSSNQRLYECIVYLLLKKTYQSMAYKKTL